MTQHQSGSSNKPHPDATDAERWLTPPNLVTCLRMIGSPGLVVLALIEQPVWFGVLAVGLVFTEWLDGFLARGLHAESEFGARLDTVADSSFYASLLVAVAIFKPGLVTGEGIWIIAALISYACSWLASVIKFRRFPSYHTWMAKGAWIIVALGIVCLLLGWTAWPFRIAMACVLLANLEATAITLVLSRCEVNVPSYWHARQLAVNR